MPTGNTTDVALRMHPSHTTDKEETWHAEQIQRTDHKRDHRGIPRNIEKVTPAHTIPPWRTDAQDKSHEGGSS